MDIRSISLPEVYQESNDFRFFIHWIALCFSKIQYDIENMPDLYDSLRCPKDLLWMLSDTMGYKYDERFTPAYARFVLLYFMSMIRNRGSKDGMTLAAEVNLAQFRIAEAGKEDSINYDRLDDTSLPVNTAYVTPHTEAGYIDVVYFADKVPIDACIEYVRPLGMYCFQFAGVRYDARTKISIDAKLANIYYDGSIPEDMSLTATHLGHYTREDYATMQKTYLDIDSQTGFVNDTNVLTDVRHPVYYRNSEYEHAPNRKINPGYRALSSLQMCNNQKTINSLMSNIFDIGYGPQDVSVHDSNAVLNKPYNLIYNRAAEEELGTAISTISDIEHSTEIRPIPQVNPVMATIGDAITMPDGKHTKVVDGEITVVDDQPINSD